MNDKKLGYCILLLISIVTIAMTAYCVWIFFLHPKDIRFIRFSEVGHIRIDDPVKFKGVDIGRVKNITASQNKILISIETQRSLLIHQGYTVYMADIGILGDRGIWIVDGSVNNPVIAKSDTLEGMFYDGISEVLGSAWKLKDLVHSFKEAAMILLCGTPQKPSFNTQFLSIVTAVDTVSQQLHTLLTRIDTDISTKLPVLHDFSESADTLSQILRRSITEKISATQPHIQKLAALLQSLDKTIQNVLATIRSIEKSSFIEQNQWVTLMSGLQGIETLLNEIQKGMLALRLIISFGF